MKHMNNYEDFLNEGIKSEWTIEKLQKEADKYKTRLDFNKGSAVAYKVAKQKGVLDELFKNHKNSGYTEKEKIKKE